MIKNVHDIFDALATIFAIQFGQQISKQLWLIVVCFLVWAEALTTVPQPQRYMNTLCGVVVLTSCPQGGTVKMSIPSAPCHLP